HHHATCSSRRHSANAAESIPGGQGSSPTWPAIWQGCSATSKSATLPIPDRPAKSASAIVSKEWPKGVAAPTPVIQIGEGELTVLSPHPSARPLPQIGSEGRRLVQISNRRSRRCQATSYEKKSKNFPRQPEKIPS